MGRRLLLAGCVLVATVASISRAADDKGVVDLPSVEQAAVVSGEPAAPIGGGARRRRITPDRRERHGD